MTHLEKMAELEARLASAETERDTWRTSGMQEKFLEAFSRADALTLQLDAMRLARPAEESVPEMTKLGVHFDGRQYRYRDYRYDRLEDALAYARLELARGQERS